MHTSLREETLHPPPSTVSTHGDKGKARDILAAIRTLKKVEEEHRPPTEHEREMMQRFAGFGPVALSLFPDPLTAAYKDASWQRLGEELRALLSDDEYESARRTTFNAFYTSPDVISAVHAALDRLGIPDNALVLEPGCGVGRFMATAKPARRFIGVELDMLSGRLARALYPDHDIRIENFGTLNCLRADSTPSSAMFRLPISS